MTDNNDTQHAPRMLRTRDLESGEELFIVYFPRPNAITVNGYSVTRSQKSEDIGGKAVFHRTLSDKLFTVATDGLSELYW